MALTKITGPRAPAVGRRLCLAGAAIGVVGLLGWLAGSNLLVTVVPGQAPMMPNTAIALVLVGIAGALASRERAGRMRRAISVAMAVVVLAMGIATLAEYAFDVEPWVDRLFIHPREVDLWPFRGRPSPLTAWALTCLGAAILLLDFRRAARARPSEWLLLSAGLTAFTATLGQLYGGGSVYRLGRVALVAVAVPTAVSLLATTVGLLLERPDAGLMRLGTSKGPGGILLRRLGLAALLAPLILGLAVPPVLAALGVADVPIAFALLTNVMTALSLVLLTITAAPLDRTHEALEWSRARTRDLIEHAGDGIFVADLEGRYTDVNDAGCGMLGYTRDELLGHSIADLIPPEELPRLEVAKQKLLRGEVHIAEWTLRRKDGTSLPVEVSARIIPDGRWQGFVRDISERKRAEERLRQTQERLELALAGGDLAAWDWNIETGEVILDPRWAEMRGLRPDEVRPHVDSWIASIHPEDLPRVQRVLHDYLQDIIPAYETEHRVFTRSGEWIWILDRGRVFARDAQGKPTRMAGTELDITARKRTEEALRLSEAKFSGIVSVSADAILTIDESQRITTFNAGAEKIFGYSTAEVLGAPLDLLLPARFRATHRREVESFATGENVARRMGQRSVEIFGVRKNGDEFPADAAISRLDVGGKRMMTAAVRDVTDQKRVEREQRFLAEVGAVFVGTLEYEETLDNIARLAVHELADACIVATVEEDGQVRRRKAVTRDPSKAWVGEPLLHVPIDPRQPPWLWTVLETREPLLVERVTPAMVASWAHGEEHLRALRCLDPRSLLVVPLLARGKLLGAIVLVSSTPSRVYGPADVRSAEGLARLAGLSIESARLYGAAQRATQARDDMLGIVAHDLRNPLSAILMHTALLQRSGAGPEVTRRPAEAIGRAATRMNRLIQDLLDVTRMEAGHLSVERARLQAAQVVSDCVEAESELASSASVELHVEVAANVPEICADRDRLRQVFENLVGNALKFTKAGGRITVGAAPRERDVVFWVADTGVGIAAEELPHLFDRFWQGRKARHRGAGLGLPIVKGIVEAHGGRVWVESAPERGSTFYFTIPAAAPAEAWTPEPAPHGP